MGLVTAAQAPPGQAPEAGGVEAIPQPPPQMPEGTPVAAQGEATPQESLTKENDDLTPEEREAYDAAMRMVSDTIYSDDTSNNAVMTQLENGEPIEAIADVTLFIIDLVEQAFNGAVPESIVVPVSDQISDMLLELMEAKGMIKLDQTIYSRTKAAVMNSLMDAYGVEDADMEELLQGVSAEEATQMRGMFEEQG